jgi:uncharacterized protein (TIGR02246 family)
MDSNRNRLLNPLALLAAILVCAPGVHAASNDHEDVVAVLARYKAALERRDLTGVEALFADRNEVVENGKLEGSYADYRDHHIGPELAHVRSFRFDDYRVVVRFEGPVALATETFRYTIDLEGRAEPIVRDAVATSVLARSDGAWKILSHHGSSRAPRPPAKP